ncbi:tRNA (adenosine(37)-N6)-threonylcarbamoyltransferase complex ATPase subunit type 1 TsaE [Candidatus Saccharibacteria bacterium]|nr:tRNA (adenosine(37)-N6)-threonylcarbamoyltransferase complex ATPase subunit type 1 TsaE [Candidatus Saccharibacteria bacterium]
MKIHSEQEMLDFGKRFADYITGRTTDLGKSPQDSPHATIIELIGDVGTGKTTFTRGLAKGLGITQPITSPSFTISKSYPLPGGGNLIHYDFYRLNDAGLMADNLREAISENNSIIVIEWANSISDLLPNDRIVIDLKYNDTGDRDLSFQHHKD